MPVQEKDELKSWQRRDRRTQLTVWAGYFVGMMVFVWCWQLMSEETFWDFVSLVNYKFTLNKYI